MEPVLLDPVIARRNGTAQLRCRTTDVGNGERHFSGVDGERDGKNVIISGFYRISYDLAPHPLCKNNIHYFKFKYLNNLKYILYSRVR
jgi:hypothetical protein